VDCERESEAAEAACEREGEAPGPSLPPVTCRDCGAPFDVDGHKRRQLQKGDKCDPLSCYYCRGRRRSAYFRARDAALTAGAGEVGAHATGEAAARAAGQRAWSLGAALPPWAAAAPAEEAEAVDCK